ncbi:hypothetical protein HMPREF3180_00290 [Leptotrichia wadei]|uniref:Uncharacterized protein n=2 Tax=Leptotrichia wadei TaxID=157687 RepID=A0A134APS0_9FUSO|nr:hypothetical protein HMPREF3180_00290 [Leptotrichia wadei]
MISIFYQEVKFTLSNNGIQYKLRFWVMKNKYFDEIRNKRLDREKSNLNNKGVKNKKRNKGASLVYVLVILSIISAFSINFVYYVQQKKDMIFLKSHKETKIEKKFLIQKENQNIERILKNGINFDGNLVLLEKKERYFDSVLKKDGQNAELKNLIFLGKDIESIGNYRIKSISDESDNEYSLPLEENKVYGELKVIFARKILDEEILFCEKIVFKRVSPLEVEMKVVESEFL